jgi:uncharacterized protein (DUF2164 family)
MTIELPKEVRAEAIKSIERYFEVNMEERIGNIQAGALLAFFLEEIGPSVYNKAIADAQERMQMRARSSTSSATKTSSATGRSSIASAERGARRGAAKEREFAPEQSR